jgi:hypothetical protein
MGLLNQTRRRLAVHHIRLPDPTLTDGLASLGYPDRTQASLGEGPLTLDSVAELAAREEHLTPRSARATTRAPVSTCRVARSGGCYGS